MNEYDYASSSASSPFQIYYHEEWFEYGLLPRPSVPIDHKKIRQLARNLAGKFNRDPIELSEWLSEAEKPQYSLDQELLSIYYSTCKTLLSEAPTAWTLTLFMFVQMFHHLSLKEHLRMVGGDEYPLKSKDFKEVEVSANSSPTYSSPSYSPSHVAMSPRMNLMPSIQLNEAPISRKVESIVDRSNIHIYIKSNMQELLLLLKLSFLDNDSEQSISIDNLQELKYIFKVSYPIRSLIFSEQVNRNLSQITRAYFNLNDEDKAIRTKQVEEMILNNLCSVSSNTAPFLITNEGFCYSIDLSNLPKHYIDDPDLFPILYLSQKKSKAILISPKFLSNHRSIRIHKCHYSTIYIIGNVKNVTISDCSHCTIFISTVKKFIQVYHSDDVTLVTLCGNLSVSLSKRCTFCIMTETRPILNMPLCSHINFAPFNANYNGLSQHYEESGLDLTNPKVSNLWYQPILLYSHTNAGASADEDSKIGILKCSDFHIFEIPFNIHVYSQETGEEAQIENEDFADEPIDVFLKRKLFIKLPLDYLNLVTTRYENIMKLRDTIKAKLKQGNQTQLLEALIDERFRAWMKHESHNIEIANLMELAKVIPE